MTAEEIQSEIEATFINIDKEKLRKTLTELGARCLQDETLMQRTVFDVDENEFIRVRDEGDRITLSYKRLDSLSLSGMKEICLTVDDYAQAVSFLKALGFHIKAKQETLREEWLLDDVELDIDTWPWLPPFVEIEGKSEKAVRSVAKKVGFDFDDALFGGVDEVYKKFYNVTSREVNQEWHEIKFGDGSIPEWLEKRRR